MNKVSLKVLIGIFLIAGWPVIKPGFPATGMRTNPDPIFLPYIPYRKPGPLQAILNQVDQGRLLNSTNELVTLFGPRHYNYNSPYIDGECTSSSDVFVEDNLLRSLEYMQAQFEALGYQVSRELLPEADDLWGYNLVAVKTGAVYPDIILEVGAHIDSYPKSPGASDNASGVAAMLEITRIMQTFPNRYTLRFVTFVGEEFGLKGSRYHVSQISSHQENLKFSLLFDAIGWSELGAQNMNCIWDHDTPETRRVALLFDQVRQEFNLNTAWRLCSGTNQLSDNIAYWENNFPAVLSIGGLPYLDPNYHSCSDTVDNMNLSNVYYTTLENLGVLIRLDQEISSNQ